MTKTKTKTKSKTKTMKEEKAKTIKTISILSMNAPCNQPAHYFLTKQSTVNLGGHTDVFFPQEWYIYVISHCHPPPGHYGFACLKILFESLEAG